MRKGTSSSLLSPPASRKATLEAAQEKWTKARASREAARKIPLPGTIPPEELAWQTPLIKYTEGGTSQAIYSRNEERGPEHIGGAQVRVGCV